MLDILNNNIFFSAFQMNWNKSSNILEKKKVLF